MPQKLMLGVVKEKPGPGIAVKKIPIPTPKKGEVLVKVVYASICGTDIGIYDWTPWAASHIKPPCTIGHELVGKILQINGKGGQLKVGDLVSSETHIFCGKCYQCKVGRAHVCENLQLYGIGRDGGFAEYATIPIRTAWKNDKTIPHEAMSVQEPLGNAVHAISKAGVKNKKVLIVGLGPVGLCAAAAANAYGAAKVATIDPSKYRRQLAKKLTKVDTADKLSLSQHGQFDVIIEASGHPVGLQASFDAARIAGKIIAVGIPKDKITFDWGKYIIDKELTIESIFGRRIWQTWQETSKLLKSGKIDLTKLITHRFKLEDFNEAMKVMKSGECGKILLEI